MRWLDLLFAPREDERVLRECLPAQFAAKLSPSLVPTTRPPAIALLSFHDPLVRAAIHEAKYHGSERAFSLLAECLADSLETRFDLGGKRSNLVWLVPVPLGRARRRERGYNQVEEVARRALKRLALPNVRLDPSLLTRVRETPTQISLARREREENMRGAFAASLTLASAPVAAPDARYVVLDDVLTTGATLGACVEAFVGAGVPRDRVFPIALAHSD